MADTVRFSSKKGNATGIEGVVRDTGLGLGEYNHMIFNDPCIGYITSEIFLPTKLVL
jgi:hypothetical protein